MGKEFDLFYVLIAEKSGFVGFFFGVNHVVVLWVSFDLKELKFKTFFLLFYLVFLGKQTEGY